MQRQRKSIGRRNLCPTLSCCSDSFLFFLPLYTICLVVIQLVFFIYRCQKSCCDRTEFRLPLMQKVLRFDLCVLSRIFQCNYVCRSSYLTVSRPVRSGPASPRHEPLLQTQIKPHESLLETQFKLHPSLLQTQFNPQEPLLQTQYSCKMHCYRSVQDRSYCYSHSSSYTGHCHRPNTSTRATVTDPVQGTKTRSKTGTTVTNLVQVTETDPNSKH